MKYAWDVLPGNGHRATPWTVSQMSANGIMAIKWNIWCSLETNLDDWPETVRVERSLTLRLWLGGQSDTQLVWFCSSKNSRLEPRVVLAWLQVYAPSSNCHLQLDYLLKFGHNRGTLIHHNILNNFTLNFTSWTLFYLIQIRFLKELGIYKLFFSYKSRKLFQIYIFLW